MPKFEIHFDITNRTVVEAANAEEAEELLKSQFERSEIDVTGDVDLWDEWGQPNIQMNTEVLADATPTGKADA